MCGCEYVSILQGLKGEGGCRVVLFFSFFFRCRIHTNEIRNYARAAIGTLPYGLSYNKYGGKGLIKRVGGLEGWRVGGVPSLLIWSPERRIGYNL
jgi:hypothetical protein